MPRRDVVNGTVRCVERCARGKVMVVRLASGVDAWLRCTGKASELRRKRKKWSGSSRTGPTIPLRLHVMHDNSNRKIGHHSAIGIQIAAKIQGPNRAHTTTRRGHPLPRLALHEQECKEEGGDGVKASDAWHREQ